MNRLDTVLLKVASRCNINCSYCYVYHLGDDGWRAQPKVMSEATMEAVADALQAQARVSQRPFAIVLHGGEPLLLGAAKLERLLSLLRRAGPEEGTLNIQTNGILISDKILDICAAHRATLSVSLDGPELVHDRFRVGHNGNGTFARTVRGLEKLRRHADAAFLYTGLLAVVDPSSDPVETYRFFKTLAPSGVDFLYRDGNHSRLPHGKHAPGTTEYGAWAVRLCDYYLQDPQPLRIRFVDDLVKLLLGGQSRKEGAGLTDFGVLIIDTDGAITKNDTLKSAHNGADRFARGWSVHTHSLAQVLASQEYAAYHAAQNPSAQACQSCAELAVCGGGMPLHRWRDETGYDNPSVYCADQLLLIGHLRRRLEEFCG